MMTSNEVYYIVLVQQINASRGLIMRKTHKYFVVQPYFKKMLAQQSTTIFFVEHVCTNITCDEKLVTRIVRVSIYLLFSAILFPDISPFYFLYYCVVFFSLSHRIICLWEARYIIMCVN